MPSSSPAIPRYVCAPCVTDYCIACATSDMDAGSDTPTLKGVAKNEFGVASEEVCLTFSVCIH